MNNLLNGWQYQFAVTAFDKGDKTLDIDEFESSFTENEYRVFAGTQTKAVDSKNSTQVGVYPNPYKTSAAWDGTTSRTQKIYFTNLPAKCTINVYTSNGDLVATMEHTADSYQGADAKWFEVYGSKDKMVFSGGEHAWDLLSASKTTIATGVYLFTVSDQQTGNVAVGKFAVMK
jgi:hypothetical protein